VHGHDAPQDADIALLSFLVRFFYNQDISEPWNLTQVPLREHKMDCEEMIH
jgi:hypothetical protein